MDKSTGSKASHCTKEDKTIILDEYEKVKQRIQSESKTYVVDKPAECDCV